MREILFHKPNRHRERQDRKKPLCRWKVEYELTYDIGVVFWSAYYHTRRGAVLAAWWHDTCASRGGRVRLIERHLRDDGRYYDFQYDAP